MAEVYWVRKPIHTDVFTQGYVGVTSKTAEWRFKRHKVEANSSKNKKAIFHKAIKALGADNLILEVLCVCSEEYAYDLERKLRPAELIGWNQNIGGTKPPSQLGKAMSQETKDKISSSNSKVDSPLRSLAAVNNSPFKPGYTRDDVSKEKHRKTLAGNGPWNNPAANKQFWKRADVLYTDYLSGLSITEIRIKNNLTRNTLKTMYKHFVKGWIPLEDESWIREFGENA